MKHSMRFIGLLIVAVLALSACAPAATPTMAPEPTTAAQPTTSSGSGGEKVTDYDRRRRGWPGIGNGQGWRSNATWMHIRM